MFLQRTINSFWFYLHIVPIVRKENLNLQHYSTCYWSDIFILLTFQVDDLVAIEEEIELEVKALETCAYSNAVFTEILGKIQKAVDNLSLHSYSNLPQWVAKLDQRVRLKIQ